jgi:hypothetical protein
MMREEVNPRPPLPDPLRFGKSLLKDRSLVLAFAYTHFMTRSDSNNSLGAAEVFTFFSFFFCIQYGTQAAIVANDED